MPSPAVDPRLVEDTLAGARREPFWLDTPARPDAEPPLAGSVTADLAVVGGGYTGLWTALLAKEADPGREVVLLEGRRIGWAASGRNGGFVNYSLTHGTDNGHSHLPRELETLERLGHENLDAIDAAVAAHGWDCDYERTGALSMAVQPYQLEAIRDEPGFLDAAAVRARVDSPTYLGGLEDDGNAIVDPAKLAWELRRSCLEAGVRIHEHSAVTGLRDAGDRVEVATAGGRVLAHRVALGTNVFPALLKRWRWHTVPVYDHALVTEPLTAAQWDAIGWKGREGLDDLGNRFHYYRPTADGRILFGGYDAVYHFGRTVREEYDHRDATYRTLAEHLLQTFPQLEGIRVSHTWGGAIDTCSRFFPFFATGHGGRVAHTAGFTGLGVAATRFAARVMLDLLAGERTELTELELVRRRPIPFPPEPFAWAGIRITTRSMVKADENGGRRDLWLRALDAVGMGFDS